MMQSVHCSLASQSRKSPSTTPARRATERSRSDSKEGLVARLAGGVEGDFRDWEAIEQWTDGFIAELSA